MAAAPASARQKQKKTSPNPTPHNLLIALQKEYSTRFHMFLIVAAAVSVAVLTTRLMLNAGVTVMWTRYAVALVLAYATFFAGVWVWLQMSPYGRHLRADWGRRNSSIVDVPPDLIPAINPGRGSAVPLDVPFQAGGGTFDGGGADVSWDVPSSSVSVDSPASGLMDEIGSVGAAGGDEGGCLLVIAGVLIAAALFAVFGATIYVVYQAPAILAEVIFEVLLGSPLARGAKALDSANWAAVLLKKTWIPFTVVAALAMVFAAYCSIVFPAVTTAGQLVQMILK